MRADATLNQLKAYFGSDHLPSSYEVYFKNTLVALCHALEDHILQQEGDPLVIATFQQGKWYQQEAKRYAQIVQKSGKVVIASTFDSGFASISSDDTSNVSLVEFANDNVLTNEWNLIIIDTNYAAAVLTYELLPAEYNDETIAKIDTERKFYGLWTFDRAIVDKSASILIDNFAKLDSSLAQEVAHYQQQINQNLSPLAADLTGVVARIVSYLQTSQEQLITLNRQAQELVKLEGQALKLNRNLKANKLQAFLRMAQKVDQRDIANPVASLQVAALSETLGQIIDLSTLQLRRLKLAGLLFRVGLAEAPIEVFTNRASELKEKDLAFWRNRAILSSQLLGAMPELESITKIVLHQLEYWDGSGQPQQLKGEEIPIESRILGLAIYFQELTQTRGTREALTPLQALEKCNQLSGIRFDPSLLGHLDTFIRLSEMGMVKLPDHPSHVPPIWLEDDDHRTKV